ncbi:MAG TPA: hypothetical protein VGI74_11915 [Streptosporangiaceae bacterium]
MVVAVNDTSSGLAFQLAQATTGPHGLIPPCLSRPTLDVMAEDVALAEPVYWPLGTRKLDGENVYADPAGHPFCLIPRPGWPPPIPAGG